MEGGLYPNDFSRIFSSLLQKTHVSCYQISKYTGLDEGYLARLRSGVKRKPSVETIMKINLAFAHYNDGFSLNDAEHLLNSLGYSLTPKRSHRYD